MVYFYHITGKTRLLYIDILQHLFNERKDKWISVDIMKGSFGELHYSDEDGLSPIVRNKFVADKQFVRKDYLASINSDHCPVTYIIKDKRIINGPKMSKKDKSKWFLKPASGWGGTGIQIFNGCHNYTKYISDMRATYVLQREVSNPMLFEDRKFDIRTFVAMIYHKKRYHVYLFPESVCRTSLLKYIDAIDCKDAAAHITNTHMQQNQEGYSSEAINKLFSTFDWSEEMYPKFEHITQCVLKKMKAMFTQRDERNVVEVISFDYIVDTSKRVFLIELNRNIGYGMSNKPQYIKDMYLNMFGDLLDFAYEPICDGTFPNKTPSHWKPIFIF